MAVDQGLVEWVKEAMAPVGTVTSKRLFGGAALYLDGLAFAILAFDALWLKADAESASDWGDAERFSVTRENGKVQSLNYRRAPDETYDDADALRRWGLLAIEAARRAPPKKLGARKRARRRTRAGS